MREEVTAGWRKLHNEELNNLYSSPNIIRIMESRRVRWVGYGDKRNTYILLRKPKVKRQFGRPRHR
jgi:hypothetical protein